MTLLVDPVGPAKIATLVLTVAGWVLATTIGAAAARVSGLSGNSADDGAYRMDPVIAEQLGRAHPLARHLDDFLTDLANAGASAHTRRAYRGNLIAFAAHHGRTSPS
ncbi:hypothetical protein ACBJ59_54335 [Nonomuraea sp. MTCD27]|uniref:hypothetical protein n=1 Tax=Nonomuraea sp. MTCD27 TaxID=1676747 RepID=UPI0035C0C8F0